MTKEYLSGEAVAEVKLPVLNPISRVRKIREYAGELAAGADGFENIRPFTRSALVVMAHGREVFDTLQQLTVTLEETSAQLKETIQSYCRDVSDSPAQSTLFEEGEI